MRYLILTFLFVATISVIGQDSFVNISTVNSGNQSSESIETRLISTIGQSLVGVAEETSSKGQYGILNLYGQKLPIMVKVIEESPNNKFSMTCYPNPVKDQLNIRFRVDDQRSYRISLRNIMGKEIGDFNYYVPGKGIYEFQLDLSELLSGLYQINTVIDGKVKTCKIIKIN